MSKRMRNFYDAMMKPEIGDLAVGITMLIVAGFLLGISIAK